jgi:hypothetical protein
MLTLSLRGLFGARRKEASSTPFQATAPATGSQRRLGADLIFRMKSWPQLPEDGRTADIYRVLSVMSNQPVNRQWLIARSRMAPRQLDKLLMKLVADGALEVIDPARFAGREPRPA